MVIFNYSEVLQIKLVFIKFNKRGYGQIDTILDNFE